MNALQVAHVIHMRVVAIPQAVLLAHAIQDMQELGLEEEPAKVMQ